MYVNVFYFHEEKQQIGRSYIRSHYSGHANAEETFQSIQAWFVVWFKLDLTHNLVQVSLDGTSVNWKTVEIIKEYLEHHDPNGPDQTFTSMKGRLPKSWWIMRELWIKKCSILISTIVLWTQVASKWESIENRHRVTFSL